MGLNCFDILPDLKARFEANLKKGMTDQEQREAGKKLAIDYHKELSDELNKFKKGLGLKQSEYISPDKSAEVEKIKSDYETKINELKTNQNAIPIRIATPPVMGEAPGSSKEMGSGVPESGEATNAQGGIPPITEEGKSTGQEEADVTSIKNEITRAKREEFDLMDEEKVLRKDFGTSWDEAKAKIENGYNPQDLIDELKKKPRSIDDVEVSILLHHQNTKEIELIKTNEQLNEAVKNGDKASMEEANVRRARLKDELQDIYDVDKKSGTITARGLSARQMMTDRKYNLVNMEAEIRAANDGKPLTQEQEKDVEQLHKKIKETQFAFDEYVKNAEAEIKGLQEKILGKSIKNKKSAAQKLREIADKVEKSTFGKANLPGGTELQGISFDINKAVANGIRLVADGLEKGGELLDLIKKSVEDILKEYPDEDGAKVYKALNKEIIESGIVGSTPETKKLKDLSDIFSGKKLDRNKLKFKSESQRAKNEFDIAIKKSESTKRTKLQKAQDVFVKWQRGFKLSNPLTMGKLVMAGVTRLITTPVEDIIGAGYSFLLPKLAKGAIGEGGGINVKETADAYKNGLIEGMKDSYEIMRRRGHGKSNLDTVFGGSVQLPPEAIDFFGQLHSATKAPFKRFGFERSLSKRLRRSIANGIDVSDPLVQTQILLSAYKDGNRAIFMQDNKVANGWQKMINYFEKVNPKTGKAELKPLATTFQWMLPFVKIPTNIAAEIGTHIYGVPVGVAKIIHNTFTKGMENLSADEKDIIFRNLKKGTFGIAALALGYFNPQTFGGYYQPGEKRKEGDAKAGHFQIGGVDIPAWLIESPIFQVMQIGATVRRVKDSKVKGETKGLGEGIWAGTLGLADHVPLVDQPLRIAKIFESSKERKYYIGELAKSTIDPALLSYLATATDPADKGSIAKKILNPENKRKPETVLEHIESGIPGLRETIPEKKPTKSSPAKHSRSQNKRPQHANTR